MRPRQIPGPSLDHLVRVFFGESADLEPEDFWWVRVLVEHEVGRRRRARRQASSRSTKEASQR